MNSWVDTDWNDDDLVNEGEYEYEQKDEQEGEDQCESTNREGQLKLMI